MAQIEQVVNHHEPVLAMETTNARFDTDSTETKAYPPPLKQILICAVLGFSVVMPVLDISIVATAVPSITDEFHSSSDIGWYGSAYLLTLAAMQLPYGRAYTIFSIKHCFITAFAIFEVGSVISAIAPSSAVLIFGRAVAGVGDSGITAGAINILAYNLPLRLRSTANGAMGILFGCVSALGPLVGGFLTTKASWRWCFAINPIIGVPTAIAVLIVLRGLELPDRRGGTLCSKAARLDWIGLGLLLPSIVFLLVSIQLGGTLYAWSSPLVVVLLVLSGVFAALFVVTQWVQQAKAMLPIKIVKQRSLAAGALYCLTLVAGGEVISYYIPIWFQAVNGVDALRSGIMALPLIVASLASSIFSGVLITKLGYYTPFMILSSVLVIAGSAMVTKLQPDSPHGFWVPAILLVGLGLGTGVEVPRIAAQTVLKTEDMPLGVGFVVFAQYLGQSIFISVFGTTLNNRIAEGIRTELPNLNVQEALQQGATAVYSVVPPSQNSTVKAIVSDSMTHAFYICLAMACASFLAACAMEWKSVKAITKNNECPSFDREQPESQEKPQYFPRQQELDN